MQINSILHFNTAKILVTEEDYDNQIFVLGGVRDHILIDDKCRLLLKQGFNVVNSLEISGVDYIDNPDRHYVIRRYLITQLSTCNWLYLTGDYKDNPFTELLINLASELGIGIVEDDDAYQNVVNALSVYLSDVYKLDKPLDIMAAKKDHTLNLSKAYSTWFERIQSNGYYISSNKRNYFFTLFSMWLKANGFRNSSCFNHESLEYVKSEDIPLEAYLMFNAAMHDFSPKHHLSRRGLKFKRNFVYENKEHFENI